MQTYEVTINGSIYHVQRKSKAYIKDGVKVVDVFCYPTPLPCELLKPIGFHMINGVKCIHDMPMCAIN